MSEQTRAILATVVILGCFALLGFMVYEKASGAEIAATSAVGIIVAWVTRAPEKKQKGGPGPSIIIPIAGVVTAAIVACGCAEPKTPREQARSVVLTVAEGVKVGDASCASVASARKDLALAETCAAAVSQAREALLVAEAGVDAWDAAEAGKLPCATKAAAAALERLIAAVRRAGGKTPPVVDDALKLAPMLAGACNG